MIDPFLPSSSFNEIKTHLKYVNYYIFIHFIFVYIDKGIGRNKTKPDWNVSQTDKNETNATTPDKCNENCRC